MVHPKRLFSSGVDALILTSPTGCWDRTETNDIAFVLTSSVDLEEDGKYRVAYMLPLPGSMGGASGGGGGTAGGKSYYIDSEVGTTLRDAAVSFKCVWHADIFLVASKNHRHW